MIEVIDKNIILRDTVEEIKKSGFRSVSADEVTSSNVEILFLCFAMLIKIWKFKKNL